VIRAIANRATPAQLLFGIAWITSPLLAMWCADGTGSGSWRVLPAKDPAAAPH
jgi:hypothetical protein